MGPESNPPGPQVITLGVGIFEKPSMRGHCSFSEFVFGSKGKSGHLGVSLFFSQSLSVFSGKAEALKTARLCLGTKGVNARNVCLGLHPRMSEREVVFRVGHPVF